MVDFIVEFDYVAEQDDELTLKSGEVIKNVIKQDGGWWEGEIDGKKGMFPDNFVKEIKKEKPKPEEPSHKIKSEDRKQSNVAQLQHKLQHVGNLGHSKPAAISNKNVKKEPHTPGKKMVKVTFAYVPENEDELRLEVGDIVEITKQDEVGWWEGNINGKVGMFPSNFVEVIPEAESEEPKSPREKTPVTDEDEKKEEIAGKKVKGVGLGNIFSAGPIKLRSAGSPSVRQHSVPTITTAQKTQEAYDNKTKRSSTLATNTTSSSPERPPSLPPRVQNKVKPIERARVLFSYSAENEDELSLNEGDTVVLIEKDLEDAGWWKGELDGKVGVFPDNFVEVIPEEKPKKTPPVEPVREPVRPEKPAVMIKKEKEDEGFAAPSLPKKPAPPPIHDKPRKPLPPKLNDSSSNDKKTDLEKSLKDSRSQTFDSLDSTEKLHHPTATRVKQPNKRPPSIRKETTKEAEEITTTTTTTKPIASPQVHRQSLVSKPGGQSSLIKEADIKKEPPILHSHKETNSIGHDSEREMASALNDIRKEIAEMKMNSVSRSDYDRLKDDFDKMNKEYGTFKTKMNAKVIELMDEIDEEKKIRLATQVEMERIRKLAMSS